MRNRDGRGLLRPATLGLIAVASFAAASRALPATEDEPRADREVQAAALDLPPATLPPPPLRYAHLITRLDGIKPPHLDGHLDDEAWAQGSPLDGFIQRDPEEGQPASERTEARILYDEEAVYVGVHAYDSEPERIVGLLTRRDESSDSDWLSVSLDSFGDRRTAFDFEVNPVGVKRDVYRYDDTGEDETWDAVWDVATAIQDDGWCAEYRIPFSQLRFTTREDHPWGIQIARYIARKNEHTLWKPISKEADRWVSEYGELDGIHGIEPPHRIELLPYTVAGGKSYPREEGDPFNDGGDVWGRVGLDLKYGIASDITLDATVNPDFGQVEADPSVINLSEFETFYAERRPFFLEGTDKFRYGLTIGDGASEPLFYTRRIGRAPQGDADGDYVDYPDNTTILGAAKVSGKIASGLSFGLVEAVTQEETAEIRNEDGRRDLVVVEPFSNYLVGRVARDFRAGQTVVGGIATATNRQLGGTDLDWLHSAGYAAGADLHHRFLHREWTLNGKFAVSHVRGSTTALIATQRSSRRYYQRPDAPHVAVDSSATSLTGSFAMAELGRFSGRWRGSTYFQMRSPDLEINDLGFQRRADEIGTGLWLGHQNFDRGQVLRRRSVNLNLAYKTNFGGEKLDLSGNVNGNLQFSNYWNAWAGIAYGGEALHTNALRGGPAMIRPPNYNAWAGFSTDTRKRASMQLDSWVWHQPPGHAFSAGGETEVVFRIASNLDLGLSPSYEFLDDDWQYISEEEASGEPQYVMAQLVQQTLGVTARINWTFTPEVSLQAYVAPYLSAGQYTDFRRVVDPRNPYYHDRFDYFGPVGGGRLEFDGDTYTVDLDQDGTDDFTFDNPDFSFQELLGNAVLRWEYRPGSTLFLVYQHQRGSGSSFGEFHPADDLKTLMEAEATHTVLVKVSYWWSL